MGLAALADGLDDVNLVLLESWPEFTWHCGLMFDDATLQVPFLADLVSLVEPAHPLSFLSYLRDNDRLYQFYVRERFHPTRREYEAYLRWCAAQLESVHFGHHVVSVEWDGDVFQLTVERGGPSVSMAARHLVLGVGTEPAVPAAFGRAARRAVLALGGLSLPPERPATGWTGGCSWLGPVRSECALDLLRANAAGGPAVSWLTRTPSFAPFDYSKLVLEMTTPSYVDYFHALEEPARDRLVKEQWRHYKGISPDTLDEIHEVLYQRNLSAESVAPVELQCGVAVEAAVAGTDGIELTLRHTDSGCSFQHLCDAVVAATGYRNRPLPFLTSMDPLVRRDASGRWVINRDHSVGTDHTLAGRLFVANAELHSHGVAAPDLGIGAIRNATILNAVAGRECFRLPKSTAFTSFAVPDDLGALFGFAAGEVDLPALHRGLAPPRSRADGLPAGAGHGHVYVRCPASRLRQLASGCRLHTSDRCGHPRQ